MREADCACRVMTCSGWVPMPAEARFRLQRPAARMACMALLGLSGCHGLCPDAPKRQVTGHYPGPPHSTRVVALGPLSARYRLNPKLSPLMQFITGQEESPPGRLPRPLALAVRDKKVIICDTAWDAVMVVDPISGSVHPLIRPGEPVPDKPVAVTVDAAGQVYVADVDGKAIFVVADDGTVSRQLRPPEEDNSFRPVGVACGPDHLFVADAANHCVQVFSLESGAWSKTIGRRGTGPGEFQFPVAVAVGPEDQLYVVDMINGRAQIFDPAGQYIGQIGVPGNHPGQFARPRGVAVDLGGIVYVTDSATQVVQMFDSQGRLLMYFGGGGAARGCMTLPAGICVDRSLLEVFCDRLPDGFVADYLILVANSVGERGIGVYAFGIFENAPALVSKARERP